MASGNPTSLNANQMWNSNIISDDARELPLKGAPTSHGLPTSWKVDNWPQDIGLTLEWASLPFNAAHATEYSHQTPLHFTLPSDLFSIPTPALAPQKDLKRRWSELDLEDLSQALPEPCHKKVKGFSQRDQTSDQNQVATKSTEQGVWDHTSNKKRSRNGSDGHSQRSDDQGGAKDNGGPGPSNEDSQPGSDKGDEGEAEGSGSPGGDPDVPAQSAENPNNQYKYRALRKLGKGGYGTAFLVQRIGDDPVLRACKVCPFKDGLPSLRQANEQPTVEAMRKELKAIRKKRSKLLREVEVLNSMPRHDRVCRFYEFVEGATQCNIFLEYYDGGDLSSFISYYKSLRLQVPEGFIWHSFLHLAQGLAYLHEGFNHRLHGKTGAPAFSPPTNWKAVIHADLKPGNIFLRRSRNSSKYPSVVIGDLGAARYESGNHGLYGTIGYQPPEIPTWSTAGDVWAMGAVVHTMCHRGATPISGVPKWFREQLYRKEGFRSDHSYDDYHNHVQEEWECQSQARMVWPLTHYTNGLEELMGLCLNFCMEERPSARELITDIELSLEAEAVPSEPLHVGWGPAPIFPL